MDLNAGTAIRLPLTLTKDPESKLKPTFTTHPVVKQLKSPHMSQSPFQKFVTKKKNSAVKESFRQEKKKIKK